MDFLFKFLQSPLPLPPLLPLLLSKACNTVISVYSAAAAALFYSEKSKYDQGLTGGLTCAGAPVFSNQAIAYLIALVYLLYFVGLFCLNFSHSWNNSMNYLHCPTNTITTRFKEIKQLTMLIFLIFIL